MKKFNFKNKQIVKGFKSMLLFLSVTLLFMACGSDDVQEEGTLKPSPTLTFTKLIVDKEEVTKEQLLQQIKEKEKEGYTIKNIIIDDTSVAEVDRNKMSLKIKKAGTFTIKIILQKSGYQNVNIEATIVYLISEKLTFDKLTTARNALTKEDILKQVKGNKDGFTIKDIIVSDNAFAQVKGTAPDFSITLKKAGDFTAKIVLEKTNHTDVTINAAAFSGVPEKFTFRKLTAYKKTLNKDDILKQIPEKEKAGYALKSIDVKDATFANVTGTAPNLSLKLLKIGDSKADITLSKTGYLDTTIQGAEFNHIAENLSFTLFKTYKKTLTKNDILNQVQGNKNGYSITKITVADTNFADVSSTTYSLTLKKEGKFAIKITLQKTGFTEVKIDGEIEYKPKPVIVFSKLVTSKKLVTKAEIENQMQGTKNGYNITNITIADNSYAVADNNNFSLILKKTGSFTATITLGRTGYFDLDLQAVFEGKPQVLTFDKLSTYKKLISKDDILKQVRGATGYVLKSITVNQSAFARANNDLSLTILKEGDFTANITLAKNGYFDTDINNAEFKGTPEDLSFTIYKTYQKRITKADVFKGVDGNKNGYAITKITVADGSYADVNTSDYSLTLKREGIFKVTLELEKAGSLKKVLVGSIEYRPKPSLTFTKLITSKKDVAKAELENQIQGVKNGYAITKLVVNDGTFATVDNSNLSLTLKKAGTFTVTLTLGRTNYFDVTVTATIQGKPANLTFDNPMTINYATTIPGATIFQQILGAGKSNYAIKSISNISDSTIAEAKGAGANSYISVKKAGSFDATIVLQRNGYLDVTIPTANFIVRKAPSKSLTFNKLTIPYQATIDKAALQTRITGEKGYTISRIYAINPNDAAALTGSGLSLSIKKLGTFTANIVLAHPFYADATVIGTFEITRGLQKKTFFCQIDHSL